MGKTFFSIIVYILILFSASKILKPAVEKEENKHLKPQDLNLKAQKKLSRSMEKPLKFKRVKFVEIEQNSHREKFKSYKFKIQ